MTEYEQRESGLIISKEKPKPPERIYGSLEIQDEAIKSVMSTFETMYDFIDRFVEQKSLLRGGSI